MYIVICSKFQSTMLKMLLTFCLFRRLIPDSAEAHVTRVKN